MNPTPSSSNGGPQTRPPGPTLVKRKKPQNDPFFKPRKPTAQPAKPLTNGHPAPLVNGHRPDPQVHALPVTPSSRRSASPAKREVAASERASGFSDPNVVAGGVPYTDYKLVTTKRDMLNGIRYHFMRISAPVDITNESQFPKPARLHRRDPRAAVAAPAKEEMDESKDGLNQEQREMLSRRKEERQREREANLAMIAPTAGPARKAMNFKKKTQQVFRPDYTEQDKRRIQTTYEEKLPWHLEDFDNKHCLVGQHKQGYAQTNVAFALDPSSGKCRIFPVEKVYNFDQRREDKVPKMTIEEVERAMKKRAAEPEWLIRQREARQMERAKEVVARRAKGLFSGAQVDTVAGRQGEEADLDFDDDFADDEEGDLFLDKDEDQKLAEKRIKEDQLTANLFDMKTEKEYDKAEEEEKKEAEARKRNFRELRKALEKRERNYNHGSDSEGSYGSSTDSEEERERLEKARLAKLTQDGEEKKGNASSSGTNTPSGRKEKHDENGLPRSSSSKSLKRPGSPNLSEASGTDASASRKKKHKSRHVSSTQPTPQPSRPTSPANVPPSSSAPIQTMKKRKPGTSTGAGSDTETARGAFSDAGAMSDGSKAKRLKLNVRGGKDGSLSPSSVTPQGGSRASSPKPQHQQLPAPTTTAEIPFPTVDQIRAAIPAEGISVRDFVQRVSHPKERRQELIKLVGGVARVDKETKLLMPRS